jgi:uncharacterized protein YecE (DUF72 family)
VQIGTRNALLVVAMHLPNPIYVGCAGWSLRKEFCDAFPVEGTHLERYAQVFNCVEINSSFYRPHRRATYERWAASTPEEFRFSVQLPKQITHVRAAADAMDRIDRFAEETAGLAQKLGLVLVQFPASVMFDLESASKIFTRLRRQMNVPIACEPRHLSWFEPDAESFLSDLRIDRVAADPNVVAQAAIPGGYGKNHYYRWHGSPRMYYSAYDDLALGRLAARMTTAATADSTHGVWCVFDNTAEGAAQPNALRLMQFLKDASNNLRFTTRDNSLAVDL